jgi:signal transduction histidine kinase
MREHKAALYEEDLHSVLADVSRLAENVGQVQRAFVCLYGEVPRPNAKMPHQVQFPMTNREGKTIGHLYLTDTRPLKLSAKQKRMIGRLAKWAAQEVERSQTDGLREMAVGLAHEINNPLSIIYAKTWNLKQLLETEKPNKNDLTLELDRIHQIVGRIARIIRGMRAVTRSSPHELMEPIRLSQVLTDTRDLCQARIQDQGIRLSINCQNDEWIQCRESEISQILLSLLKHSTEALVGAQDPWIEIRTEKSGSMVRIIVCHGGKGLIKGTRGDMKDRLWIPGLLAKQHGGELHFDTKADRICFRLELPILENLIDKI